MPMSMRMCEKMAVRASGGEVEELHDGGERELRFESGQVDA